MLEGDSGEMCAGKFPLVSMGGQVEGLACADTGARTPIGASGIMYFLVPFPATKYMSETFFLLLQRLVFFYQEIEPEGMKLYYQKIQILLKYGVLPLNINLNIDYFHIMKHLKLKFKES